MLWTGVGCIHAFYETQGNTVLWLETSAPGPPDRHSYRFERDWEHLAASLRSDDCGGLIERARIRASIGQDQGVIALLLTLVALPAPSAPIPTAPKALAVELQATERSLDAAIDRWDPSTEPPRSVALLALYEQRIIRSLAAEPRLARVVVKLDPAVRDDVAARSRLASLGAHSPPLRSAPRVGPAPPAARLRAWYGQAQARFGIRWQVLAAINFVESAFGKVRNTSTAGAQGPMQFEPATWRAYGLGGDVHDPHDAILGAAHYLAASGGTTDERAALRRYNRSSLYAEAVERYASRMTHDPHAFYRYYNWSVYIRTPAGSRRVSGP